MALNKYLACTYALIDQYKAEAPFTQFTNLEGHSATFDDLVWFHNDPNTGKKTRVLTGKHGTKGLGKAGSDPENRLREPYGDLVKVYAIEAFNATVGSTQVQDRISHARYLLTKIQGDLWTQNSTTIGDLFTSKKLARLVPFIKFCEQHGCLPVVSDQLHRMVKDKRDRTGHNTEATRNEKIPQEEVIKAVGNVYGKTINSLLNGHAALDTFRDAWTSLTVLLCCASPNRAAAEVSLLANQKLQRYSEDNRAEVFYLDWHGSKGYQDNKNHILASLSNHVEKGLNYFSRACQPGRIIAAYYIDPNQTLGALLGDFPIDPIRKARLDLNCKPHLFTLGYALGFYHVDAKVDVFIPDAEDRRRPYQRRIRQQRKHASRKNCWQPKKIYELRAADEILSATHKTKRCGIPLLFGVNFQGRTSKRFNPNGNGLISIIQAEKLAFELHNEAFPSFPIGFSTGDQNSVRMDVALFCVLGHQFFKNISHDKRGGTPGGKSYYAIVTPKSLSTLAAQDLGKRGKFFSRHGFPSRFFLNLHSLRHYTNTYADKSGIPNEVLTAWSGRKSREQTFEYVHTSHAERNARVSDVQIKTNDMTQSIRWVSNQEIEQEFNLPASVTSTGVCTQNLIVSPCEFLNDFISTCFMCPNACHVAGDTDAITMLEKDYQFQQRRIEAAKADARFKVSMAMQNWFILHNRNTQVLAQLVQLMKEKLKGTVISYNDRGQQFNLVDTRTKEITHVVAILTDSRSELENVLEQQRKKEFEPQSNDKLAQIMAKYNLKETE